MFLSDIKFDDMVDHDFFSPAPWDLGRCLIHPVTSSIGTSHGGSGGLAEWLGDSLPAKLAKPGKI